VPEELAGFFPVPRVELLGNARLVCSDNDPYCPEGAANLYAGPTDLLEGEGHINPDAGYGAWPAVEGWARDGAVPLTTR
jgi:predicted alpha/beta hydrolase family esterase